MKSFKNEGMPILLKDGTISKCCPENCEKCALEKENKSCDLVAWKTRTGVMRFMPFNEIACSRQHKCENCALSILGECNCETGFEYITALEKWERIKENERKRKA